MRPERARRQRPGGRRRPAARRSSARERLRRSPFGTDLADAATVPDDWAAPEGVVLCGVLQSSDATAVLQYATSLEPDAVLDAWEPLLGGYATERSDGIGGWPILNAYAGELELAIQTDGDSGTVVIGFQEGAA